MKTVLISIICLLFISKVNAADSTRVEQQEPRKIWVGLSGGINNPSALAGLTFDVSLNKNIALFLGTGIGSWGSKVTIGAKYYKEFPFSGSFNASFSTVSGGELKDYEYKDKKYNIELDRVSTLNLSYQPHFKLGNRAIFSLEVGYSIAFKSPQKAFHSDVELHEDLNSAFKMLAPGGLILGLGFSFGF